MMTKTGKDKALRVLVLDDIATERELIIRALSKQGLSFSARQAESKETFIRELEDFRPDIVLSDYSMPSFDGLQALALVQERFPATPVIIVTGTINEQTAVDCIKKGAADYVLKEFLGRLGSAVAGALDNKRLHEEIQQQQNELSDAARDWQITFDAIDSSVLLMDAQQKIIRCNKATEGILHKPSAEIVGRVCYELFHCLDHPIHGCPFLRSKRSKDRENIYLSIDGKTLDVIVHPLLAENGTIRGAVHVMNDITVLLENQQKLQKSEERFRDLYDNAPSAYFTVNIENGTILQCNKQAEILLGYSQEALIGMNRLDLYADTEHGKVKAEQLFALFRQGKAIHDQELQLLRQNGETLWISLTVVPVFDDTGKVVESRSSMIDISARKNIEKQLLQAQKMETIGTLAGGIAHDFNNVLSAILGFTQLALEDTRPASNIEEDLQEVLLAGNRAKELVLQILTFARQNDELTRPVQINPIAKEVLKFVRSSIPTTITIEQVIESESLIMGNPTQIHQIIMNLCTNAAYAMDESGGILMVSLKDVRVDTSSLLFKEGVEVGDYIELKVSDTGTGIPPEVINSIFEPYYTTKPTGDGTGMGLAVVQGIVGKCGGKITVKSLPGEGTVFSVYLPVTEKTETEQLFELKELSIGTERILFVDDEASIVKMASRILGKLGYKVTTRTSSIEALSLFTSNPDDFDLVITDMTMPDMTGDVLAAELMTIRPDLPLIICTGYSRRISETTASKVGIKACITKPFTKSSLAKIVRKILDEAKTPSQS